MSLLLQISPLQEDGGDTSNVAVRAFAAAAIIVAAFASVGEEFVQPLNVDEGPGVAVMPTEPPVQWRPPYEPEDLPGRLTMDEWPGTSQPWALWTEPSAFWSPPFEGEDLITLFTITEEAGTSQPWALWTEPLPVWTAPFEGEEILLPLTIDEDPAGVSRWTELPPIWTAPFAGEEQFKPLPIDEWPGTSTPWLLWTEPPVVWTPPFAGEDQFRPLTVDDEPAGYVYFTPEPAPIWTAPHEGEDWPRFPQILDEPPSPAVLTYDVAPWAWPQPASEEPASTAGLLPDDPTFIVMVEPAAWVKYTLLGEDYWQPLTVDETGWVAATASLESPPVVTPSVSEDSRSPTVEDDSRPAWFSTEIPIQIGATYKEEEFSALVIDEFSAYFYQTPEPSPWVTILPSEDFGTSLPLSEDPSLVAVSILDVPVAAPARDEEFGGAHPTEETGWLSWSPSGDPVWITSVRSEESFAGTMPWEEPWSWIVSVPDQAPAIVAAAEEFGAAHPTEEGGAGAWALAEASYLLPATSLEDFGGAHPTEDTWATWSPLPEASTRASLNPEDFAGSLPWEESRQAFQPSELGAWVHYVTAEPDFIGLAPQEEAWARVVIQPERAEFWQWWPQPSEFWTVPLIRKMRPSNAALLTLRPSNKSLV